MITADIKTFADANWNSYQKTITALSSTQDKHHRSLVQCEKSLYSFDDISDSFYDENNTPTSADALSLSSSKIDLIEFKSGFKKNISKDTFDILRGTCEKSGEVCEAYWSLFFKHQKAETNELIASIRLKAIESYITFEKHVFPKCHHSDKPIPLNLIVVIDDDGIDEMEDTLSDLSGKSSPIENNFTKVKAALRRLVGLKDCSGHNYFYDEILVMSAKEFLLHINYEIS